MYFHLSPQCYKVNPAMPSIYAVGTYSRGLAVYLEPQPHTLCYLDGQKGGITYIKFSPDGTKLLAGGRKDDEILVWDMRNPGRYISKLVFSLKCKDNKSIENALPCTLRNIFT